MSTDNNSRGLITQAQSRATSTSTPLQRSTKIPGWIGHLELKENHLETCTKVNISWLALCSAHMLPCPMKGLLFVRCSSRPNERHAGNADDRAVHAESASSSMGTRVRLSKQSNGDEAAVCICSALKHRKRNEEVGHILRATGWFVRREEVGTKRNEKFTTQHIRRNRNEHTHAHRQSHSASHQEK